VTVGKLQATAGGKMLIHASGKLMAECCCDQCELDFSGTLAFRYIANQVYTETQDVSLINTGDSNVTWLSALSGDSEVADNDTVNPSSGSLNSGISVVVENTIDGSGIGVNGTYTGTLTATGSPGACTADVPVTLLVAALFTGNIKYHLEYTVPGFGYDGTFAYQSPGYWFHAIGPVERMSLWIDVNGARLQYRNAVGVSFTISPDFDVTFRYSDGYPAGISAWWNGWDPIFGGNPIQVEIGPSVW